MLLFLQQSIHPLDRDPSTVSMSRWRIKLCGFLKRHLVPLPAEQARGQLEPILLPMTQNKIQFYLFCTELIPQGSNPGTVGLVVMEEVQDEDVVSRIKNISCVFLTPGR